ncbi:hypothetical protein [Candidatus Enterovibrio altilux]|uniref:Uncharacterized protein n=1 Tax=Candidatus Enterovibrio altilux TaxID=1927128 RepID=A0A291BB83_9GAMM|nr:hypothetical protein [Candidatus Enterovibrio luxaltus]ATF10244.1 hypothetical protein BTN50_1818 [Candidatus Enterovibrio luxaltus]
MLIVDYISKQVQFQGIQYTMVDTDTTIENEAVVFFGLHILTKHIGLV